RVAQSELLRRRAPRKTRTFRQAANLSMKRPCDSLEALLPSSAFFYHFTYQTLRFCNRLRKRSIACDSQRPFHRHILQRRGDKMIGSDRVTYWIQRRDC